MYQTMIRECAARIGRIGIDPRHVEAWMRLELGTLDWIDRARFAREVEIAIACIDEGGIENSERLAQTMGL